jgi:hypothetical protein
MPGSSSYDLLGGVLGDFDVHCADAVEDVSSLFDRVLVRLGVQGHGHDVAGDVCVVGAVRDEVALDVCEFAVWVIEAGYDGVHGTAR